MIKSFRGKETENIWNQAFVKKIPHDVQRIGLRKLFILNHALTLDDLKVPPGNRLERLVGDRKGSYSIRINDQWRVCFKWSNGDAYDIEIVDYH